MQLLCIYLCVPCGGCINLLSTAKELYDELEVCHRSVSESGQRYLVRRSDHFTAHISR